MNSVSYYSVAILLACFLYNHPEGAGAAVGINYGLLGDNLPPPSAVVSRLQEIEVTRVRLFQPDKDVLTALQSSGISVIIGTYNEDLKALASDASAAAAWVETNLLPYSDSLEITCVAAGNEVYPGELEQYLPAAMQNLNSALIAANLTRVVVSTAVSMSVLSTSFPPSSGAFAGDSVMAEIAQFLSSNKYPLLVNMYPYYPRVADPPNVALEYALFERQGQDPTVRDGPYNYLNLFDAMADAAYAALEKVGAADVEIIVAETGWPTDAAADASVQNAAAYVNNLVEYVYSGSGTPRRPGKEIEAYIFAMFNENLKPQGREQHWGLHYPDLTPVYHVNHF